MIAYVDSNEYVLYYRISTDGGATWGAEQTYATVGPGSTYEGVALCGAAGYVYLAYTIDDILKIDRYVVASSAWAGTLTDAAHSGVSGAGVAVDGSVQRIVLGGTFGLKRRDYDWSGAAWETAVNLVALPSGTGYSMLYPRIFKSPDGSGRWYYSYHESWTVNLSGSRVWLHCTPYKDELGEGLIFDQNRGKGWDLLYTASYWYMVSSVSHYRCVPYSGTATQKADLGADVVAIDLQEAGGNMATRGRIWLQNRDGRYSTPGSGTYAMIREDSRVALGLGYRTSAGVETAWLPPLWIDHWRYEEAEGEAYLVIEVGDAWRYLDRCRARYQVSYASKTLGQIAERLLYRVSSTQMSAVGGLSITADAFTIKPGDSIGQVLRRMLDRAGVLLRFHTTESLEDPGHWDACVLATAVKGTGSSGYSYNSSSHRILKGEFENRRQPYNLVEVYGSGWWDYRHDSQHIHDAGHVFLTKEADWHLDSEADVADRRDRLYYDSQSKLVGGWLESLPHLGAELYDVVDVTSTRAGLSSVDRRIGGIRWRYDTRKSGVWLQRLDLEAV